MRAVMIIGAALLLLWAGPGLARDHFIAPEGQTADQPDGSRDRPWPTVRAALRQGAVSGGDRLLLLPGMHGPLTVRDAQFDTPVTITAAGPDRARVARIDILTSRGLVIRDLDVWPDTPYRERFGFLVRARTDTADITFEALDIRSGPDAPGYLSWDRENWLENRSLSGIHLRGANGAAIGNRLRGIANGIAARGAGARVIGNRIEGFRRDGLRGLGDGGLFRGNRVENCVDVDDNHDDGFQAWTEADIPAQREIADLVIEGNRILEWTGPAGHPLRCRLQGIGLFRGPYRDLVIQNNLIAVSAYHGIAVMGAEGARIVNNTVVPASGRPSGHPWFPWIHVDDYRDRVTSRGIVVANNIAANIRDVTRRGQKVLQATNAIVRNPSTVLRAPQALDFRLKPDSPLRGRADRSLAPAEDIDGRNRGPEADPGAIELP